MTQTLPIDTQFRSRVALITGGASGIGLGAARSLAREDIIVVVLDPNQTAMTAATQALAAERLTIHTIEGDVSNSASVRETIEHIRNSFGRLDIVVNSAAIQPYGTVVTMTESDWDRVMAINLKGIYLTAHYAIPLMREQKESVIVNIASVQGLACQTNVAAYVASKGAVLALTRAMALDHAKDGIRVNAVCPGSIDTPMLRFAAEQNRGIGTQDEIIQQWGLAHPLGRVGSPEEVGNMVAFLCSEKARFCTGADFKVDGGLLAKLGATLPR